MAAATRYSVRAIEERRGNEVLGPFLGNTVILAEAFDRLKPVVAQIVGPHVQAIFDYIKSPSSLAFAPNLGGFSLVSKSLLSV